MRVLGIDTANRAASVALIDEDKILAEEIHDNGVTGMSQGSAPAPKGNHAEILIPLIETVFTKTQLSFDDIAGIAISIGPGSFTGLRIGLATVKGLAYQNNLPMVGVSTLMATALRATESEGVIAAMLDARKCEVYMALFSRGTQGLTRLTEDVVTTISSAVKLLIEFRAGQQAPMLLVGEGAIVYEQLLRDSLGPTVRRANENGTTSVAACVGRLGALRLRSHSVDDLGTLAPLYLRPSEAESKLRKLG